MVRMFVHASPLNDFGGNVIDHGTASGLQVTLLTWKCYKIMVLRGSESPGMVPPLRRSPWQFWFCLMERLRLGATMPMLRTLPNLADAADLADDPRLSAVDLLRRPGADRSSPLHVAHNSGGITLAASMA